MLKPHPYFSISPTSGLIPGNGSIDINVTFFPFTLGSCIVTLRLDIGQYGFEPIDCMISGIAVSGLIESSSLLEAEGRFMDLILSKTNYVSNTLDGSTFRGDNSGLELGATTSKFSQILRGTKLNRHATVKSHNNDPVATVLAATFKSSNVNATLTNALGGTALLGSKVVGGNANGSSQLLADGPLKVRPPWISPTSQPNNHDVSTTIVCRPIS